MASFIITAVITGLLFGVMDGVVTSSFATRKMLLAFLTGSPVISKHMNHRACEDFWSFVRTGIPDCSCQ